MLFLLLLPYLDETLKDKLMSDTHSLLRYTELEHGVDGGRPNFQRSNIYFVWTCRESQYLPWRGLLPVELGAGLLLLLRSLDNTDANSNRLTLLSFNAAKLGYVAVHQSMWRM